MRFEELVTNILEIDDNTMLEYIHWADDHNDGEYIVDDFINFLEEQYYISDFIKEEDYKYNLKQDFFIDELNRIKEE